MAIIKQDTKIYISALLGILSATCDVYDSSIKLSAATNLKSRLNKLNRKREIPLEDRFAYGEQIYAVMCSDYLNSKTRTMCSYALYPLLSGDSPTDTIPHFSALIAKNMMTGLVAMTASL